MKKTITLILVIAMAFGLLAGCSSKKEDGMKLVESGKLIMATNATFPPYEMLDDSGNFIGIDVEIAGAIAKKLGLELQIDDMGFTAALEAVQNGSADVVLAGVTVNESRKAVMDFSDSYANGVQVVIIKEDSDIKTLDDLNGKTVGCQMGTTGYILASDTPENGGYGEDKVTSFDNGITAVQALKNDQVDCVIIDKGPAEAYVKENPGLKIMSTEWANESYAIGFAKGNTQLQTAVNNALKELTADGTIQSILDKYIKAN